MFRFLGLFRFLGYRKPPILVLVAACFVLLSHSTELFEKVRYVNSLLPVFLKDTNKSIFRLFEQILEQIYKTYLLEEKARHALSDAFEKEQVESCLKESTSFACTYWKVVNGCTSFLCSFGAWVTSSIRQAADMIYVLLLFPLEFLVKCPYHVVKKKKDSVSLALMDQISPRGSDPGFTRIDTLIGGTSLRNLTARKLICCPLIHVAGSLQDPKLTFIAESLGELKLHDTGIEKEKVYYLPILRRGETLSNCFMVTANPIEKTQQIDEASPGYTAFQEVLGEAEGAPTIQFSLFLPRLVAEWIAKHPASYRNLKNIILLSLPTYPTTQLGYIGHLDTMSQVCSHFVYHPSIGFN